MHNYNLALQFSILANSRPLIVLFIPFFITWSHRDSIFEKSLILASRFGSSVAVELLTRANPSASMFKGLKKLDKTSEQFDEERKEIEQSNVFWKLLLVFELLSLINFLYIIKIVVFFIISLTL